MKKLIITLSFVFLFSIPALAQCPSVPVGYVCITQEAANKARNLALEAPLKDEKITTLENGIKVKEQEIADIKRARDENEVKLIQTIHNTEVKLSFASGQVTQLQAETVRDSALIEYLVKNQRSKQQGLFNIKLGGN